MRDPECFLHIYVMHIGSMHLLVVVFEGKASEMVLVARPLLWVSGYIQKVHEMCKGIVQGYNTNCYKFFAFSVKITVFSSQIESAVATKHCVLDV